MSTGSMTGRDRMLAALHLERVDRPPVWFMRQAGRHLPGYRAIRGKHSFLEICRDESLNVEVSAEPWRRYGVDGAIVFNDILTPLEAMGMEVDFVPGPRFGKLITASRDVAGLARPEFDSKTDVSRCIGALRACVGDQAAVLGFVGAPFTVASFAIAGSGPQRRGAIDELALEHRGLFEEMQKALIPVLIDYARAQVEAGADVIQVFESLGEALVPAEYRRLGLASLARTIEGISQACPGTPIIVFGRGMWPYIEELARTAASALSLDDTDDLRVARMELCAAGSTLALQGNLPPEVLRAEPLAAGAAAGELLSRWREIVPFPGRALELGPTGWVFNLGHGVPADSRPESVEGVMAVLRAFDFSPRGQEAMK